MKDGKHNDNNFENYLKELKESNEEFLVRFISVIEHQEEIFEKKVKILDSLTN